MKRLFLLLTLFCHFVSAAPIVIPVGPAADADCQFNSIQAAIDSGQTNMDIRVSQQLDTVNGISIIDKNVAFLRGGYASCEDAMNGVVNAAAPYSSITSVNTPAITIKFVIDDNHTIDIQNFLITPTTHAVDITNGGANISLTVNFDKVDLKSGTRGLYAKGMGVVVNFDNGSIYDFNGVGGVECTKAEMNFGEFVAIYENSADIGGGGIFAFDCTITLDAGDNNSLQSLQYGIYKNKAQEYGAGIALIGNSSLLALGTAQHPVSISNNGIVLAGQAVTKGAGLYLSSDSIAIMGQVRLDGNTAFSQGAAIYMDHNDLTKPIPQLQIGVSIDSCSYSPICNSVSFNQTTELAVNSANGAVIYQNGGTMVLGQTNFQGNSAIDNALFYVENNGTLGILSDLIADNNTQTDLFDMKNQSFLSVNYSTLANNPVNNYFNVQYDNNNEQTLEVKGTILHNGAATVADLNNDNGNHDAQTTCSLVENNDASGVVQNGTIIGTASFIGAGNYQLEEGSLGLNSTCTTIGEFDLVRYDILNVDRLTGSTPDLGAYQMGYMFHDGFE